MGLCNAGVVNLGEFALTLCLWQVDEQSVRGMGARGIGGAGRG